MSLSGGQPNFARCLAISWTGTLHIHFRGLLPPDRRLTGAEFTLRSSLAFYYIGSFTARHSRSGRQPNFVAWYNEWNYGTFAEGITYIRLGSHHNGHWPTFYLVFFFVVTFSLLLLFRFSHFLADFLRFVNEIVTFSLTTIFIFVNRNYTVTSIVTENIANVDSHLSQIGLKWRCQLCTLCVRVCACACACVRAVDSWQSFVTSHKSWCSCIMSVCLS